MTRLKKILCLLVAMALTAGLFSGCGKGGQTGGSDPEFQAYCAPLQAEDILTEGGMSYATGRVLLTAQEKTTYDEIEALASKLGGEIIGYISATGDYQLYFPDGDSVQKLEDYVNKCASSELVASASLSYAAQLDGGAVDYSKDPWIDAENPGDTSGSVWDANTPVGNNWWAEAIGMPAVWQRDLSLQPVRVGLIDTMFDLDNEDLSDDVFAKTWNNPQDEAGNCNVTALYQQARSNAEQTMSTVAHGSHVAGIIAARAENGFGIAGISQNASLYGYAMSTAEAASSDEARWGDVFQIKCGLANLLNEGCQVINISMSFDGALTGTQDGDANWQTFTEVNSQALETFLQHYIDAGQEFLLVKSAGNNSSPDQRYDAANDVFGAIDNPDVAARILMVGAASYHENYGYYRVADFSNTGTRVDLYAPGVRMLSDVPDNQTVLKDGTSMAAPVVTGIAALIWGVNPDLSAAQVRSILSASASATMFDLDDESFFIRDLIEALVEPTAIVNADICVQLAQSATADGAGEDSSFGALTGVVYAANGDGGEVSRVEVDQLALYDADQKLVMELPLQDIAAPEQSGQMQQIQTYFALVAPGTYTLEATADGYMTQKQQVTIQSDSVQKLDLAFVSYDNLVTDAYRKEFGGRSFAIPQINLPSDEVQQINREIWDTLFTQAVEPLYTQWTQDGSEGQEKIQYEWTIQDGILSLCIDSQVLQSYWPEYLIYNLSVQEQKPVQQEDILQAAGLTEEAFREKAEQALGSAFWKDWNRSDENFYHAEFVTWFNDCLHKTIAAENIDASTAFFNADGQLCIAARVYTLAGAEYYWQVLNLSDFVLVPDYAEDAQLLTHDTAISQDEAYQIACDYWDYTEGSVDEESGFPLFVVYGGLTEGSDGASYHSFRLRWLIDDGGQSHASTIDTVYVNAETGACSPAI